MTREEAIEKLKNFADHCYPNEEFLTAIKALEQEPKETWSIKDVATTFERHGLMTEQESCEDAISRADARHLIAEVNRKTLGCISTKAFKALYKGIDELPSVTPKPKTDVLDKIKNEITMLIFFSRENVVEIIDKYKAEKEK